MARTTQPSVTLEYTFPYTIKADATSYVVFGVMFGALTLFGLPVALKTHGNWGIVLAPLGILLGFWAWLFPFVLSFMKIGLRAGCSS